MIYVLGATIAGLRLGRGPGTLTAIASVAAFDFFFVPPRLTFQVSDAQYLVTFLVMLAVTLTIGNLMANVRQQNRVAGARERRTALLYAMSRELAGTRGSDNMARVAVRHVAEVFDSSAVVLTPDAHGTPAVSGRQLRSRARSAAPTSRWRSGSSITASAPDSAPTRCRPRRPSTCRCGGTQRSLGVLARAADQPAARAAARAAAPARDVRRADRAGLGTGRPRRGGGDLAHRGRDREPAQHAAGVDLARPAHAAGGDHRRGQHAGPPRRDAGAGGPAVARRSRSKSRRRRCPISSRTCST